MASSAHTRIPPHYHDPDQVGWAQRLPRTPDAGRELTVLLRWKYSPGWLVLSTLRENHHRLQEFTMPQLEFAARHSRYRGGFRFYVAMREGETLIALSDHLRRPRREQAFGGADRRIASRDRSASTSTSTSDMDGTAAPTDTFTSNTNRSAAGSSSSTGYGCSTTECMASETAPPRVDEDPDEASPWRSTGTSDEPSSSTWHDSYWDSNQSNSWWTYASTGSWQEP